MSEFRQHIPEHLKPHDGTATMFETPLLERLSKVRPHTVLAVYIPIILACGYFGIVETELAPNVFFFYFVLGVAFWTLFEYLAHRFVFHFRPQTNSGFRLQFIIHGVHHQFPQDKDRLVMPISASLLVALLIGSLVKLILGDAGFGSFAGFVFGYICYDMTHYSIHHMAIPKARPLRALWVSHLQHHFKNPERSFGVTSPLWDFVFGTWHSH